MTPFCPQSPSPPVLAKALHILDVLPRAFSGHQRAKYNAGPLCSTDRHEVQPHQPHQLLKPQTEPRTKNKVGASTWCPNAAQSEIKCLCPGMTCKILRDAWSPTSALVLPRWWGRMLRMPSAALQATRGRHGSRGAGETRVGSEGACLGRLHTMD